MPPTAACRLVVALFFGLKAAVLAIVLEAVVRIGKRALKNNVMVALAAAAFVGIFFFDVPVPDHHLRRGADRLPRRVWPVLACVPSRRPATAAGKT